jgi:hypothetical protein
MNGKNYLSKRYVYSFLILVAFLFSPIFFENYTDENLIITEDLSLGNSSNIAISTSKIQATLSDTSIPYVLDNVSTVNIDGIISSGEYLESYSSNIDLVAYWEHNGVNLSVALVAEGLGFIAIGLGSDVMDGANMIIGGYNATSGSHYCSDAVGVSGYSNPISIDSVNNIIECDASENATSTIFEFKIPMNSGDSQDKSLETNGTYNFFFTFHTTLDNVFDPGIGNHNGMPRSNPNRQLFFRPLLEVYDTQISLVAPLEVNQGENLTLKAILLDESQNPIENMNVDFFRETGFGNLIIGNETTDSNGTAEFVYSNNLLRGNVTFGVTFNELIGKVGPVDTIFRKSEIISSVTYSYTDVEEAEVRDVFFIPIEQECCAGGIFYLLVFRDALFYLALLAIWGIYFYSLFTIFGFRFIKGKSKDNQISKDDMEVN